MISSQWQNFAAATCFEPLYRLNMPLTALERELLQSAPLRRLKHLHHFGAAALVTPVTHSRLEHTLGVWALAKHLFSNWPELHAAALLHDIGHLPFSHAAERALAFDHHAQTQTLIETGPVAEALRRHGLSPDRIIELLDSDTLSHRTAYLGLDHLDSFLRDMSATGLLRVPAHELVLEIRFDGLYADMPEWIAQVVWEAVCTDNRFFLSPYLLAVDAVLSQAVVAYVQSDTGSGTQAVASMTDAELLAELRESAVAEVRQPLRALLDEPWRIVPCAQDEPGAFEVRVRKVYDQEPLADGVPMSELRDEVRLQKQELQALAGCWWFRIC